MFYSPFDIFYKITHFMPCKVIFACMKEVIRCKKVHDGVAHAAKIYPSGYLIMAMIGTIKGNQPPNISETFRLFFIDR